MSLLLIAVLAGAPADGRAEYERASRLYAKKSYAEALPWFEKAYARSGRRPSVIFGLAQCERRLGMLEEAEAHLEEFLEVAPPRRQDRGRRLLAKVRAERARVAAAALTASPPRPAPKAPPTIAAPPPAPTRTAAPKPWEAPPPAAETAAPEPEGGGLLSSPVFWIVTGALVAGGAVTAGVLLTRSSPEPYGGTSGQVFEP